MSDDEHYYHATNHERARDIADSGSLKTHKAHEFTDQSAWPDGSREKRSYFSANKHATAAFHPEHGKPAVLRVHKSKGEFHREQYTGDVYSKKPIAAHHLEIEHNGGWHPLHKFFKHDESFDEALEPHERRHLVLDRKGWQTSNGHTYTHPHLPGHTVTSHPHSKEWTHHVQNPITKKAERHGSGTWPGGHSFTGYLNSVHDRNHSAKAPEWRPMPARTADCPHCAKGVPHSDDEHKRWLIKPKNWEAKMKAFPCSMRCGGDAVPGQHCPKCNASPEQRSEVGKLTIQALKAFPSSPHQKSIEAKRDRLIHAHRSKHESAYAQEPGSAPFQTSKPSKRVVKKPAGKKEPVKEDRYLHHGHQRMHELLQQLGYRPEQPSTIIKREEIHQPVANYTRSTYSHAQWGDKAMVFSHPARHNVTVVVQPRESVAYRLHGKPETIYKRMGG